MNSERKIGLVLCWFALVFLFPNLGNADEFKLIPSLAVREEYNDNIFYTTNDTLDDFITTILLGLELIESTERLNLNLSASIAPFFYADLSDLNDVDQNYRGGGNYQISTLLSFNAYALYDVSNRPDRDILTSGVLQSNDKRKRLEYGFGFDYTLTEKAAMAISFAYLQDKWDSENLERQNLKDYRAGLNFTHNLSEWWDSTTSRLNLGFEQYEFETSDTYNYFGTIGVQHWFSETVDLLVDLGLRYTDATFFTPQLVENNNKTLGGVGQATLQIRGELTRGSIRISHSIEPTSGVGRTNQRSDVVLNFRRRFAERSVIAITTGAYKNKADPNEFSFIGIDEDTFFIRPTIRWEFFTNFTLEAGYNFAYVYDHRQDIDTNRNLIYLQVAYGLPLFE
jgi:hypothetical protein